MRYPQPDLEVVLALVAQAADGSVTLQVLLGSLAVDAGQLELKHVSAGKRLGEPERDADLLVLLQILDESAAQRMEDAAALDARVGLGGDLELLREDVLHVPVVEGGHGGDAAARHAPRAAMLE